MARQYFYNEFQLNFLSAMSKSSDPFMSGFAVKSLKEVKYHHQHARDWFCRFALGTDESRQRLTAAVEFLWPYLGEMFTDYDPDRVAETSMSIPLRSSMYHHWLISVESLFSECSMVLPQSRNAVSAAGVSRCKMVTDAQSRGTSHIAQFNP
jgi:ring-1,2-phenylacetyl-CoA epoxidase subunit PaaC